MIKDSDIKFKIVDELDVLMARVKELEKFTKSNVGSRKDQRVVMRSLKAVEKGIDKAGRIIAERSRVR